MHVPDSMLHGNVCPVTAFVSTIGVVGSTWLAFRRKVRASAGRFAAVTALIFAAQMINFPVSGGTSGHLLGGVAAAALLGVPMGVLSMTLVILIQSLLFADGGLSVLGVNLLSMAIIGAGLGGGIFELLSMGAEVRSKRGMVSLAIASWLSVVLASAFVSGMLVIDGASKASAFAAMFNVHAIIGIGEAILTVAIVWAFAAQPSVSTRRNVALPLATAFVVGGLLGPFACGYPDGLEWVAEKLAFIKQAAPEFAAPLSDYSVSFVSNEMLSTAIAGVAGVIITFAVAWMVGLAFKPQTKLA